MPIPISDQRIYNEYIPKMLLQQCGRECCLILHGPHNVRQFCTIPAVTGIDHRVFQRGKVLQHNSGRGKIPASNNNLFYAIFFISAKESFLSLDPNAVENMAADILGNATVGITQVFILGGLCGELQHILFALINYSPLCAVCPCIEFIASGEVCKIYQEVSLSFHAKILFTQIPCLLGRNNPFDFG